jgi:hypothetical protein
MGQTIADTLDGLVGGQRKGRVISDAHFASLGLENHGQRQVVVDYQPVAA